MFLLLVATGAQALPPFAQNIHGLVGATTRSNAMALDAAGNTYVAGSSNALGPAFGMTTLAKLGDGDAIVVKLDPGGNVVWAKNFGGPGATTDATGIGLDTMGNIYVSGSFDSANLTVPALTQIGDVDTFLIKLDTAGAVLWARNYGGAGACAAANALAVSPAGDSHVVGTFCGGPLTNPMLPHNGNFDTFVLKVDSDGNTTWSTSCCETGGANTLGWSVALGSAGAVFVAGDFDADMTSIRRCS